MISGLDLRGITCLIAASLVLVLAGCSDDDDSGTSVNSGLPPEQQLDTLEDSDVEKFCAEAERIGKSLLTPSRICTVLAASFAEDSASCEQIKKQCLQDPPDSSDFTDEPDPDAPTCVESLKEQLEGCDATVAELEACQNDALNAGLAAFNISCNDVPLPQPSEDEEEAPPFPEPASCKALNEKCPGLNGDDDGEFTPPDAGMPDADAGVPDAGE